MEWFYTVWLLMIPVVLGFVGRWVVATWAKAGNVGDSVVLVSFGFIISGLILILLPLNLSLLFAAVSYLYEMSVFS